MLLWSDVFTLQLAVGRDWMTMTFALNLNQLLGNKHRQSCLASGRSDFWAGGLWHRAMAEPQNPENTKKKLDVGGEKNMIKGGTT